MKAPIIEAIASRHEFIDEEKGAEFDPLFADAHWWGTPNDTVEHGMLDRVVASKTGRGALRALEMYNGGMLRLGDPVPVDAEGVRAIDCEPGTVLKLTVEHMLRYHNYDTRDAYVYGYSEDRTGFSVVKRRLYSGAWYAHQAKWGVVGECNDGRRAFFEIEPDADASYAVGLHDGYGAAVKVAGIDKKGGVEEIEIGTTRTHNLKEVALFERVTGVKKYHPIFIAPRMITSLTRTFRH